MQEHGYKNRRGHFIDSAEVVIASEEEDLS